LSQTEELFRVKARIKALTDKTVANGCTFRHRLGGKEQPRWKNRLQYLDRDNRDRTASSGWRAKEKRDGIEDRSLANVAATENDITPRAGFH
jgi:hypothetical protein